MLESLIASAVQTWGVPTAMTGLFFWLLKRHIDKQDKARAEQERNRERLDKILIQSTTAALLSYLWHERESKLAVIASWIAAMIYTSISIYYGVFFAMLL